MSQPEILSLGKIIHTVKILLSHNKRRVKLKISDVRERKIGFTVHTDGIQSRKLRMDR